MERRVEVKGKATVRTTNGTVKKTTQNNLENHQKVTIFWEIEVKVWRADNAAKKMALGTSTRDSFQKLERRN